MNPCYTQFKVAIIILAAFPLVNAHEGHSTNPVATSTGSVTFKNEVKIEIIGDKRVITSNGLPNHEPGEFPRKGNPNKISPQSHKYTVPVTPTKSTERQDYRGYVFGIAINGVPFEPGTAETWQGNKQWSYEAIGSSLNLGLDESNAHVQPTGMYHYHGTPDGLAESIIGSASKAHMTLIGWAADGYPMYYKFGYKEAKNSESPIIEVKSSYKLKKGERSTVNGGPGGLYNGDFASDYEYKAEYGDLDEHNGRVGVTPEFPQGTYYYVTTTAFPFISRSFYGVPDTSFAKKRGGQGAGQRAGPRRDGQQRQGPPRDENGNIIPPR